MPTRRQLLRGGAAGVAGAGAASALASCTAPPPMVAPKRYATLFRSFNGYRRDLVLWNPNGGGAQGILQSVFGRPAWFPDGQHLCVARGIRDDSEGTWQLWVCKVDGSLPRAITNPAFGVADLDPSVGPDGQTIVFSRDTIGFGEGAGLWIVKADGTGLHPIPGGAGGSQPSFSPDMKSIVYRAFDGIRHIATTGGTASLMARAAYPWQLAQPTWSTVKNRVAFVRWDSAVAASLCYVPGTGGPVSLAAWSPVGIESPTWGTDGNTLHFAEFSGYGSEGRFATDIYRLAIGGQPVKIFRPYGFPATDLATLP